MSAEDRCPEDIPAQILEILSKLSTDTGVWEKLRSEYKMDFFCGVFMGTSNDELEFSSEVLRELSSRGIALRLDVYDSSDD